MGQLAWGRLVEWSNSALQYFIKLDYMSFSVLMTCVLKGRTCL